MRDIYCFIIRIVYVLNCSKGLCSEMFKLYKSFFKTNSPFGLSFIVLKIFLLDLLSHWNVLDLL